MAIALQSMAIALHSRLLDKRNENTRLLFESQREVPSTGTKEEVAKEARLTVDHLDDAALACQSLGQLVAGRDDWTGLRTVWLGLVRLELAAWRIDVVTTGMDWVQRAGAAVITGPSQWVRVEASLVYDAVRPVGLVFGTTDEELEVALCCERAGCRGRTGVRGGKGEGGRAEYQASFTSLANIRRLSQARCQSRLQSRPRYIFQLANRTGFGSVRFPAGARSVT